MKFGLIIFLLLMIPVLISPARAQSDSPDDQPHIKLRKPIPEKEKPVVPKGESSSRDSQIDQGPAPPGNALEISDVQEFRPWDPHRAAKDVEVGLYYLKRKNYRAALDRFNEALLYKPKDAEATLRLAQTQEKLDLFSLAAQNYQNYLQWLPDGPLAKEAHEGLKRLAPHMVETEGDSASELKQIMQDGEEFLARNEYPEAYARFSKAIKLAPGDPVVNLRLAQSLQGLQRLDEARLYYRKCLDLQPGDHYAAEARNGISRINDVLGK